MGALRRLSPDEQVSLLFLILFGALLLVSAATVLWSLRERSDETSEVWRRYLRDLRAVWIGTALFWLAWISGPAGSTIFFGLFSFLALREFITLQHTRRSDHRTLILAFFIVLPLQYVIVGTRHFDLFTVFIPVYAFFAVPVVSALAGDPERFLERNAKIQWGIVVCVYGLSHAPALLLLEFKRYEGRGAFLLFFLVVVAAVAQVVQELASRWLRRRPVARQISRSFSLRAWFIGAFVAAWVGAALYWITPFKAGQALVMAFIAAGAGTMGEFVMKALKRDAGVHHWGNRSSVTGAVGLLDRVAPLCFAAPVFFHSVRWYFKL
ncbi:MAG TPA: phosphatidate cytidylyltransferase [Burkholderiaceae bacterium]|nr:phosphatidate cytidylyltransferase [Burkholderiaceae bacterium]